MSMSASEVEMANLRDEQAEALFWEFKRLTDRTQVGSPMDERRAFKSIVCGALRERDQVLSAVGKR